MSSSGTVSENRMPRLPISAPLRSRKVTLYWLAVRQDGSLVYSIAGSANIRTTSKPPQPSVAPSENTSAASQRTPVTRNWLMKLE
jgi:hypothetical protein